MEGQRVEKREDRENMVSIWRRIVRREGAGGLYQGLEAQITKGFVSEGVKMMAKQRYVKRYHVCSQEANYDVTR